MIGYRRAIPEWSTDFDLDVRVHRDALALPLRSPNRSTNRILGAVYDWHGRLLVDSQRGKRNRVWAGNPNRRPEAVPNDVLRLSGRTFFGGHLRNAFGHFLLEVFPRFWPDIPYAAFDHVLFYSTRVGVPSPVEPYAADLLNALGVDPKSSVHMPDRPVLCEDLTITTAPFVLKRAVHPAFLDPFERAHRSYAREADAGPITPRRLYLSRSRLPDRKRGAANEEDVEALMARAGFEVVHPQEMSIAAQALAVGSAAAIAGCDGSALHLAAFARPGTVLLSIDARPVPNQFMIDRVRGLDAVHVLASGAELSNRMGSWVADLTLVREALATAALD